MQEAIARRSEAMAAKSAVTVPNVSSRPQSVITSSARSNELQKALEQSNQPTSLLSAKNVGLYPKQQESVPQPTWQYQRDAHLDGPGLYGYIDKKQGLQGVKRKALHQLNSGEGEVNEEGRIMVGAPVIRDVRGEIKEGKTPAFCRMTYAGLQTKRLKDSFDVSNLPDVRKAHLTFTKLMMAENLRIKQMCEDAFRRIFFLHAPEDMVDQLHACQDDVLNSIEAAEQMNEHLRMLFKPKASYDYVLEYVLQEPGEGLSSEGRKRWNQILKDGEDRKEEQDKYFKNKQRGGGQARFPGRCHICSIYGHKATDCNKRDRRQGGGGAGPSGAGPSGATSGSYNNNSNNK